MSGKEPVLVPAAPGEAEEAMALIRGRVDWMDRMDIDQWNRSGYLDHYPLAFFREEARLGRLYFLEDGRGSASPAPSSWRRTSGGPTTRPPCTSTAWPGRWTAPERGSRCSFAA